MTSEYEAGRKFMEGPCGNAKQATRYSRITADLNLKTRLSTTKTVYDVGVTP